MILALLRKYWFKRTLKKLLTLNISMDQFERDLQKLLQDIQKYLDLILSEDTGLGFKEIYRSTLAEIDHRLILKTTKYLAFMNKNFNLYNEEYYRHRYISYIVYAFYSCMRLKMESEMDLLLDKVIKYCSLEYFFHLIHFLEVFKNKKKYVIDIELCIGKMNYIYYFNHRRFMQVVGLYEHSI